MRQILLEFDAFMQLKIGHADSFSSTHNRVLGVNCVISVSVCVIIKVLLLVNCVSYLKISFLIQNY